MKVKGTGICLRKWCFASAIVLLMASPPAWAAEFGKIAINDGIDDFLLAAMPHTRPAIPEPTGRVVSTQGA